MTIQPGETYNPYEGGKEAPQLLMEKQVVAGFMEQQTEEEETWLCPAVREDDTSRMFEADVVRVTEVGSAKAEEEEVAVLPGFRFHPTDEELIGFYLRRKVERRALSREIIKVVDIYKYEPWELPKVSPNVGTADMEWYFFCRRGRKYRNSIRPNRVTGKGFWKATGVDKPIYPTSGGKGNGKGSTGKATSCLGLKKSLVYYIGSAGRGTKTDWMMHEFRLPPTGGGKEDRNMDNGDCNGNNDYNNTDPSSMPEAEVWTICRIFKRALTHKKQQQPQYSRGYRPPIMQAATPAQYSEYSETQTPAVDDCGQWYSSPGTSFEVDVDDSDNGDTSSTFPSAPLGQYYDNRGRVGWFGEEHQHQSQQNRQQYQRHRAQQQPPVPYAGGHSGNLPQPFSCWSDSAHADAGSQPTDVPAAGVSPDTRLTNHSHGFSGTPTTSSSCLMLNNDILKDWTWEDIGRMVIIHPAAQDG